MSQANLSAIIDKYQNLAPKSVLNAVKQASDQTGVNFTYLMEKAAAESNFDSSAESKTSSATGLYQFIEQTWLSMVKQHGEKYGLKNFANQITVNDHGKASVSDTKTKNDILALRNDPKTSALMAAEFTAQNQQRMENDLNGKEIGATELYFAHFMGAGGAVKFFKALENDPSQSASALFPQAAKANKNVFTDKNTGIQRSLEQVYAFFDNKFQPTKSAPTPALRNIPDVTITNDQNFSVADALAAGYSPSTSAFGQSFVMAQNNMSHIQSPVMVMLMDQLTSSAMDRVLSQDDPKTQNDDPQDSNDRIEDTFTWFA